MGPIESHEKKVFRKNPNMGLQAILSYQNYLALFVNLVGRHMTVETTYKTFAV